MFERMSEYPCSHIRICPAPVLGSLRILVTQMPGLALAVQGVLRNVWQKSLQYNLWISL